MAQIAISLLLLVPQACSCGRSRISSRSRWVSIANNVLLFELNAPQAGYPSPGSLHFYADLRRRLSDVPGVRDVTLSHASLIRAGRSHPITVDGVPPRRHAVLLTGPRFFTTMQIPIYADGRSRSAIAGSAAGRRGERPLRQTNFGDDRPDRAHRSKFKVGGVPLVLEIVGVAADATIRRAEARDPAGRLRAVRAGSVAAAAAR